MREAWIQSRVFYGPGYADRAVRPTKLDPYKDYLQSRVAAAHPDWIPAAVLFEEIRSLGWGAFKLGDQGI